MITFKPGDRVRLKLAERMYRCGEHRIFAGDTGTVSAVDGDGETAIVTVMWDNGFDASLFAHRLETPPPQFYFVYPNPGPHTQRHSTKEDAEAEAATLAVKHPGTEFYVLAPVAKAYAGQPTVNLIQL